MYPLVSEELEKMDNNPEYDTYYSSMENITEPVREEDVYYEVTGERPKRKWFAAKCAAVVLAVAVIFFLAGFLCGKLGDKQECEPQHSEGLLCYKIT